MAMKDKQWSKIAPEGAIFIGVTAYTLIDKIQE